MYAEFMEYLYQGQEIAGSQFDKILNSAFLSAVFGSLAGAYFGAAAAQKLAARKQDKDALLKHINSTNSAIVLSSTTLDLFLVMKKEQIYGMIQHHKQMQQMCEQAIAIARRGQPMPEVLFEMNLQTTALIDSPVLTLRTHIFENLQVTRPRILRLQLGLEHAVQGFHYAQTKLNEWIANYSKAPPPAHQLPHILFGYPYEDGGSDNTYPTMLEAIQNYSNDSIFYAHLLTLDLQRHGKELQHQYVKRFGLPTPGVQAEVHRVQEVRTNSSRRSLCRFLHQVS
jgi:hypothetical protein